MEQMKRSENGVAVYSYPNPSLHGFYISLFVRAGSMFEEDRDAGITHFLEHVLVRNVNRREGGELYRTLDRLGLEFNACTYNEMTQFYITGATVNLHRAIDVLIELFSPIELSGDEIDMERRRIRAEIREADDRRSLATFTAEELYRGTSLSRSVLGTAGSVSRIGKRRLEAYRRRVFAAENIFFYVTGCVTEADVEALVERIGGCELSHGEKQENIAPVPKDFGNRRGVRVKNADFTAVRFNFDLDMTAMTEAETDLIYDILFSGYNSRFFIEMSEKRGLFYDVTGALDRYLNIGSLYFSFEVGGADLTEAVRVAVGLLHDFKQTLLSEDEILRAPYVEGAMLLYDDVRELNFTFAYDCHVLSSPYRTLADRADAYRRVSPERIRELARMIFRSENCTLTMKANANKIDKKSLEEILATL